MILILGADYVITYHRKRLHAVDQIKGTCVDSFQLAGRTPGFIAFPVPAGLPLRLRAPQSRQRQLSRSPGGELAAGSAGGVPESVAVAARNILTLKKLAASLHIVLMLLGTKRSRS
jgi:hypothetical protein